MEWSHWDMLRLLTAEPMALVALSLVAGFAFPGVFSKKYLWPFGKF